MSSEQKKGMNEYLEMTLISVGVVAVMCIYAIIL